MSFKKAIKSESKLRLALYGISGSGKTYTSLAIAEGLGSKIALIDTERGSASKYADKFNFDAMDLQDYTIEGYIQAINSASNVYDVLIVDSISHCYEKLLERVEQLAQTKFKGNTWSAWSEGTPLQHKFVDCILRFTGHIIVTMRSKTEWGVNNENGKVRIQRLGTSPTQRSGIEYEFDLVAELTSDHIAHVIKDRTGKFQDEIIDKPDKYFGAKLKDWLNEGIKYEPKKAEDIKKEVIAELVKTNGVKKEDVEIMDRLKEEIINCETVQMIDTWAKSKKEVLQNLSVEQKDILRDYFKSHKKLLKDLVGNIS